MKKEHELPRNLIVSGEFFQNYYSFLKKFNLEAFDACLLFICSIKLINKIVIGIDNLDQLKKIVNFRNKKNKYYFKSLICKNESLVNPTKMEKIYENSKEEQRVKKCTLQQKG